MANHRPQSPAPQAYDTEPTPSPRIPAEVRRNTLLLSASQTLYTIVAQVNVFLGAFMIVSLTGNPALAGLGTAIAWGGRLIIVYQSGKLMDKLGRVKVLQLGTILSITGAAIITASLLAQSLAGTIAGLVVYGVGVGATQQNRVAVADMFPARRRGEGIGYLLTASVLGALVATLFIFAGSIVAVILSYSKYSLQYDSIFWLGSVFILVPALFLTQRVRPEPKAIAERLGEYYPNEPHNPRDNPTSLENRNGLKLSSYPVLATFAVSGISQGNMTMEMALVPVVLNHHGSPDVLISTAITLHIVGMYGLSTVLGHFSDRAGRRPVLVLGAGVSGIGALITPLASDFWTITLGIVLVGLGWSAATVAATALLSDLSRAHERGRVIGANDFVLGAAALTFPFAGGQLLGSTNNFGMLAVFGMLATLPAILMALFLRESTPTPRKVSG